MMGRGGGRCNRLGERRGPRLAVHWGPGRRSWEPPMDADSRRWIKALSVSLCVHLWFNTSSSYCQLSPPVLQPNRPVALLPGESAALEIRGQNLEGASALLFADPRLKATDFKATKDQIRA